jgi:hypothetical protein
MLHYCWRLSSAWRVGGGHLAAEVRFEAVHRNAVRLAAYLDFEKFFAALQHQVRPPVGR